jgi:hypothetical protein
MTRLFRAVFLVILPTSLAADFTGWEHDNARFEEQCGRVVRALRTTDHGQP